MLSYPNGQAPELGVSSLSITKPPAGQRGSALWCAAAACPWAEPQKRFLLCSCADLVQKGFWAQMAVAAARQGDVSQDT